MLKTSVLPRRYSGVVIIAVLFKHGEGEVTVFTALF